MNYVKLKSAIIDAERKHGLIELDSTTREILTIIADANLLSRNIRQSDLVQGEVYGTLPTVYSKLKKLVDGGWIERTADTADGRAVLLHITPKTRTIFKRISNIIETL